MTNKENIVPVNKLKIEMELFLKTYKAQNCVWGKMQGCLGLFQFARYVVQINNAIRGDDPYADWFLIQIQDALNDGRRVLQRFENRYKDVLSLKKNQQRIIVSPDKPIKIKVQFVSPYSFIAADMLGDYDRALSLMEVARLTGIKLDKSIADLESELNKTLKSTFNLPKQWKPTQVTRIDVEQDTEKAQQARNFMGQIPAKILNKEVVAQYAPTIRGKKPALSEQLITP